MINYFCDLCEKEMRKDERYTYILPQQVPYEAISVLGEPVFTYEQLEDREVDVCNVCRRKISQALKELIKENKKDVAEINRAPTIVPAEEGET